jgi:hypothetical protein
MCRSSPLENPGTAYKSDRSFRKVNIVTPEPVIPQFRPCPTTEHGRAGGAVRRHAREPRARCGTGWGNASLSPAGQRLTCRAGGPGVTRSARTPCLSDGALWLIGAIGCALATLVLKDLPGAWEVYRTPKRYKDVMQHRTASRAVGGASRRSGQDRLLRFYRPLSTVRCRSRRAARSLRPPDRAMSARNRATHGPQHQAGRGH